MSLLPPTGDEPGASLEVATTAADTLRAAVTVHGTLSERTQPLLQSVLGTHVRAGRRYLRVDLAHAVVADPTVLTPLVEAHAALLALGGMLIFDNAEEQVAALLRAGELLVGPAA
jgi:anti-anti-sigma regulatory factor